MQKPNKGFQQLVAVDSISATFSQLKTILCIDSVLEGNGLKFESLNAHH
jgi:hypothetical protein